MRIWHQSFTVLEDLGPYRTALEAHFRKIARPDTQIELHGMRPGTYQTIYPGTDVRHAALQHLHAVQFIQAGLQAEAEGYDAYSISTLPDPALTEIRSLLDIPVVGYGESAMLTACMLGQRFGILVFIEELAERLSANAERYGLGSRFVGAEFVGFTFHDVLKAFDDPAPLIEKFRQAAGRLIGKGADVIIPGEAPLNVLLAQNGVNEVDGAVVLDSLASWIKQAETLVDLKRTCGIGPARRGYFGARPEKGRIAEVMDFYGLGR